MEHSRYLKEKVDTLRRILPPRAAKTNIIGRNNISALKKSIQVKTSEKKRNLGKQDVMNTVKSAEFAYQSLLVDPDPKFQDAVRGPDRDKWIEARDKEITALIDKDCWTIEVIPPNTTVVGCRYVCKIKTNAVGEIVKYKVRLVAQGYSQIEGVNYFETFSPVARLSTIRIILAIAAINGLTLHHIDVNCAYINAELDEEIYLRPPPDFNLPHNYALKLKKSLYGLKQSGLNWNKCITKYLEAIGFKKLSADNCVFILNPAAPNMIVIVLYVDDMIIASKLLSDIQNLKDKIKSKFNIDDLGEMKYYLGLQIMQDLSKGVIKLTQAAYIKKLALKYKVDKCKVVSTPLPMDFRFDEEEINQLNDEQLNYVRNFPIREIIGSINFIASGTRMDIGYSISTLAKYQDKPNLTVCKASMHLLKFLNSTSEIELTFHGQYNRLVGYSDANWANDPITRRSTSGFIFYLGNSPITWQSRMQPIVALSSTESEYIALTEAVKEVKWLRSLLNEVGINTTRPTTLWCDNQSAIDLVHNPVHHKRTKHIDIRYHFIRDEIKYNTVVVDKIHTSQMLADMLTKLASPEMIKKLLIPMTGKVSIPASAKRISREINDITNKRKLDNPDL